MYSKINIPQAVSYKKNSFRPLGTRGNLTENVPIKPAVLPLYGIYEFHT